MSLKDCFAQALKQGVITKDEHDAFAKRLDEIAQTMPAHEVKAQMVKELEIEAAERKRRAVLFEDRRVAILDTLNKYRNARGEGDLLEAWEVLHETYGERGGAFVQSAENLRGVIVAEYAGRLTALMQEFKRGAITGDLRRTLNKQTRAMMTDFVAEVFGENTGNDVAKGLAKAWTDTAEAMRQRFNEAGGGIGKLDYGYLPQGHSREALESHGRDPWITYMMREGVLNRERTVNPITKRKLSDSELREALGVIWDRITTDGWIDREVSGAPMGKGAIWSQHADHRFLHFKDAKAWLSYAKGFGTSTDPFHAMMSHIEVMGRDIAHMEVFGPNPNMMRTWMTNWLRAQAGQVRSFDIVIGEQSAKLKGLTERLSAPNPEYTKIADRIGEIHTELMAIRRKHTPQLGGKPSKANKAKLEALDAELFDREQEILPYRNGEKPTTIEDTKVKAEMEALFDEMRQPVDFPDRERPGDAVNGTINRADAMWRIMRGSGNLPVNTKWADRLAGMRNILTASALDGAFLTSLSDASTAQDRLLRLGVGMSKANAITLVGKALREAVSKTTRQEASRAWLGWDSAMHGFQQSSRMMGRIDTRGWTGYVADRVLTTTLLSPWTQGMKHVVGSAIYGEYADLRGLAWDKLPQAQRFVLDKNGFDAQSWDAIRAAPINEVRDGVGWLEPNGIEQVAGRELAERYSMMVHRMIRQAVVEGTVKSRSIIMADPPGTLSGEMMRAFMQFKGYPLALIMLHTNRVAREVATGSANGGRISTIGYFAAMVITGTMLGAVSMQLRQMSQGKDPKKMTDDALGLSPYFWLEALLKSTGFGIYGDIVKSGTTATGKGLGEITAGPLIGFGTDVMRLGAEATLVPAQKVIAAAQGKRQPEWHLGKRAVRVGKQIAPSHWAIDIAVQRWIWDWLQKEIDADGYRALRADIARTRKVHGQDYAWPPGEMMPQRLPSLGAAIGR